MSTHKNIEKICVAAIAFAVVLCIVFMNGAAIGIQSMTRTMGYETTLFDTSKVHQIDIEIDDWEGFISDCENEEYVVCNVVIDNEAEKNVGIRAKGNTSLRNVSELNSQRYSFKIEFDHYDSNKNYKGLDKLSLNNIIQDNTYMKDYLSYQMMNAYGVDAPLCSYAWITVNGEDWGLYLAVEGIEDSFLEREYGSESGNLYKPDSMSQGGGRGNGKDFDMDEFNGEEPAENQDQTTQPKNNEQNSTGNSQQNQPPSGQSPNNGNMADQSGNNSQMPQMPNQSGNNGQTQPQMPDQSGNNSQMPQMPNQSGNNGQTQPQMPDQSQNGGQMPQMPENMGEMPDQGGGGPQNGGGAGGGMNGDDVKLRYIDDNISSYSNIFNNAKGDITKKGKNRLIASLKSLSNNEDIEDVVNVDEVMRYFVVHNFVVNGDSYTGSMVHNYYLYENNGQLSMIPWDYNLAFGGFQGGDASSSVNDAIDTPLSVSDSDDRPMFTWITKNENYLEQYHEYYADFLKTVDVQKIIDDAYALISDYVEKDPTKFCTTEEFKTGVTTLKSFCKLRTQSIQGQLNGSIPSTDEGQTADSSKLIDASSITLSDMGSMNTGKGDQGQPGQPGQQGTPGGNGNEQAK